MNPILPPTVCLDGSAVRRIREEKKLTQLYVAKVVGVTTDTISRWENNRYPSIKRENALRLAEALETPVEDVLQGGTGACMMPEPALPPRRLIYRVLPFSGSVRPGGGLFLCPAPAVSCRYAAG
jgi:transcriptional regulator with XRE-family HTH domain